MKYKIWCKQRNQYFADDTEFDSLEEIHEQLIDYHSIDCDEKSLKSQSLYDLINGFEWEIHDLEGNIVDVNKNEKNTNVLNETGKCPHEDDIRYGTLEMRDGEPIFNVKCGTCGASGIIPLVEDGANEEWTENEDEKNAEIKKQINNAKWGKLDTGDCDKGEHPAIKRNGVCMSCGRNVLQKGGGKK